jgi:ketosteroid isomerase-like protein
MTEPTPAELVQKIEEVYELERKGEDIEAWAEYWADDAVLSFPHDLDPTERELRGKEAIVAVTAQKFVDREWTDIDARVEGLAEGRKVLARLHVVLHFANGTAMSGALVMVFTFNEDQKIVLAEEYVNEAMWPKNYKDNAVADPAQS